MALFVTAAADLFVAQRSPGTTYVPALCTQDAGIQGSLEGKPRWISNHGKSRVRRRFCYRLQYK